MKLRAYLAADAVRRRRRARGEQISIDEMGRMVYRAWALLRRFRSIHRVQVNRDVNQGEWLEIDQRHLVDHGGEG